jgi:hypothetical protein
LDLRGRLWRSTNLLANIEKALQLAELFRALETLPENFFGLIFRLQAENMSPSLSVSSPEGSLASAEQGT